ncbi:glutamyl-tRNA synthetase [Desulfobaculum xiamenense]|uniref:Glutamyl-Q tRNA(Asp) synthetase n=1 Tax=Desulfobaculum xiamenense TaxID=995050 RepID=A0A846QLL2_9BACT|nr:tRNA glutamyl-Q(34) synthetase GluQRS [Desulfobaculum xiamenense]NJB67930.1 glutamyl-tRNA synthetase [Desulfobaculum xiamenense]
MDSTVHQPKAPVRGRLAPSPTGHLHLGNIWSFLLCWLDVRSAGGTLVLRMEDIDPDRSRPEYAEDIMRDLEWLGIDWDEGPDRGGPYGPYTQSERLDRYAEVMDRLESMGLTYPCFCTRKELRSLASAPHAGDFGPAYPGTCLHLSPAQRAALVAEGRHATIRLHGTHDNVSFTDRLRGTVTMSWAECGGDFPLRRSDGVVSYQLAVAVDDMDQRITSVVRGDDILHCTPRQILLHELLGATPPLYAHVPLVLDAQGERLAKRHRHYEIRMLRERGVSAQAIIGYLAARAGLLAAPAPARPQDFAAGFDIARIAPVPVILEPDIEDILAELSRR